MEVFVLTIVAILIWMVVKEVRSARKQRPAPAPAPPAGSPATEDPSEKGLTDRIYELAGSVNGFLNNSAHPQDLLSFADFNTGAELFASGEFTAKEVAGYATGDNAAITCMALEGLARREDASEVVGQIADFSRYFWAWPLYFAIRFIQSASPTPGFGRLLVKANEWWAVNPIITDRLREAFAEIPEAVLEKEITDFKARLSGDASVDSIRSLLEGLGGAPAERLQRAFSGWLRTHADVKKLASFGDVWAEEPAEGIVAEGARARLVDQLEIELVDRKRSVLLVGERGVGKTAVVRLVADRLQKRLWTVFETVGGRLIAGNVYMGELEKRVLEIVDAARAGRKVIWIIPAFHELAFAGRHRYSPTSILDLLMPHVERREVLIIGETTPAGLERIEEIQPRAATTFEIARLDPLDTADTLELAREVTGQSEGLVSDALQLARQHLANLSEPGNVLHLLDLALQRRGAGRTPDVELTHDDLVVEVARITGLPRVILDDSHQLDMDELRRHFANHVVGQDEAVDVLVDRVAMIKAGLTDPTRPYGVFLFAGPTGTGKTEIAKTLAAFLFGSSDRMIRFDMSEFQTPDSLNRLFGGSEDATSSTRTLIRQVRENPFSILLLDEFEKSHPRVWDTFLQVFDDGRLTDRQGNVASFRHCIIIMTSNLGAAFGTGPGIGFDADRRSFSRAAVEKAVTESFRSEFLNRIDRVVVFQPLSRASLRKIMEIELARVFERRGLQSRQWAVEWDNSALEFLLDRGYSAELGARPLKRAIERYLLSPLARAIVGHEYPEGDQFLFVRASEEGIEVQFIDPDAPAAPAGTGQAPAVDGDADVRSIALQPAGTEYEFRYLCGAYASLREIVESDEWQGRKASAMEAMADPDFWQSEDRFGALGDVEFIDRIQSGLETAGSLIGRMSGSGASDRTHYNPDVIQRLAQQVYLIEAACTSLLDEAPRDAFLRIEAAGDARIGEGEGMDEFVQDLARMYERWAAKRRMHVNWKEWEPEHDRPGTFAMAVSGFGAYRILSAEAGLHVLETPRGESSFARTRARVAVAPQPDEAGTDPDQLRRLAATAFSTSADAAPAVVRRYRHEPSPLVRDAIRGWRTGNIDQVLGGDFDLIT